MSMNQIQAAYAEAKAAKELFDEMLNEKEAAYIREHEIRNEDGTAPAHLWTMDDEKAFEVHNEAFGRQVQDSGFEEKYNKVRAHLNDAEEALIKFGISLAPEREREILRKSAKENFRTRKKLIDLAFRLDSTTIGMIGGGVE